MNILLTGGTGLIGNVLSRLLIDKGYNVRILTREQNVEPPFYTWNNKKIDEKVFNDLDGIIHLAGASLMNNWTEKYKKMIIDSRVNSANLLFEYVKRLNIDLKFFISASGSSYYGQITTDQIFNEFDNSGTDFLAKVCVLWEAAAKQFEQLGVKVVCIRTPLVLASNAESFKLIKMPTALGLGACLGTGKQWMPWIHIQDLCNIYLKAIEDYNFLGPINATTSVQYSHEQFMKSLAVALNKPLWLPNIPSFLVKIGMGEKSSLVLEGSRLSNYKVIDSGFVFKYNTLDEVWEDLLL